MTRPPAPLTHIEGEERERDMSDWFEGGGSGSPVDVTALFDSEAAPLLLGIVTEGAMVSMGTTSDGGALAVTVTLDGKWRREYFRDSEALTVWLAQAGEAVQGQQRSTPASPGSRQRQRGSRTR